MIFILSPNQLIMIDRGGNSETQSNPVDNRVKIILLIIFTEVLGFSILIPVLPFLGIPGLLSAGLPSPECVWPLGWQR